MTLETTRYADFNTKHNCVVIFQDMDADGDLDMLVGDAFRGLLYFENIGDADSAVWELVDEFYATIDIAYPGFPALADIDSDNDVDLFMGSYYEGLYLYSNDGTFDGTFNQEAWLFPGVPMLGQGNLAAFCDIDGDQDLDLFCGHVSGNLLFYENEGDSSLPMWADPVTDYDSIDVQGYCAPAVCDIDDDGDADLFLGRSDGTISYYENVGDGFSPRWADPEPFYFEIDVGSRSMPEFCDIDEDGDCDLFIGKNGGSVSFYRNEGDRNIASFILETDQYASIQLIGQTKPVFADIDGDGDPDLFVGDDDGGLDFWRNMGTGTAVTDEGIYGSMPCEIGVYQNYPNPFNPTTAISYQLSAISGQNPHHTTLKIYNILGQEVVTLVDELQEPGSYTVRWGGRDHLGMGTASGIYFYRITTGDFTATKRMVLLK